VGRASKHLFLFRDWLFERMVNCILYESVVIKIKNFKRSKKKSDRKYIGYNEDGIIYLDPKRGTPRILVHELFHHLFGSLLDDESRDQPNSKTDQFAGKTRLDRRNNWEETQVLRLEQFFFKALNKKQIKILQGFIDEVKTGRKTTAK